MKNLISKYAEKSGLSVTDIAKQAGISRVTVSTLLNSKELPASTKVGTLHRLAQVLNVDVREFIPETSYKVSDIELFDPKGANNFFPQGYLIGNLRSDYQELNFSLSTKLRVKPDFLIPMNVITTMKVIYDAISKDRREISTLPLVDATICKIYPLLKRIIGNNNLDKWNYASDDFNEVTLDTLESTLVIDTDLLAETNKQILKIYTLTTWQEEQTDPGDVNLSELAREGLKNVLASYLEDRVTKELFINLKSGFLSEADISIVLTPLLIDGTDSVKIYNAHYFETIDTTDWGREFKEKSYSNNVFRKLSDNQLKDITSGVLGPFSNFLSWYDHFVKVYWNLKSSLSVPGRSVLVFSYIPENYSTLREQ